jgi:hypothetical protein
LAARYRATFCALRDSVIWPKCAKFSNLSTAGT